METMFIGIGIAAIALGCAAWGIFDRWIAYKEKIAETENIAGRKIAALTDENRLLTDHVSIMHDRIANLERIATDKQSSSAKLSDQIEKLRT
ncbi:hypothetical protein ACR9YC_05325 [Parasphingorhabdus sp. DH2-15]|uniref:hypothetical protein n=1 Tax=Parasphingorhabdus sp. DH2-15 TaxID=3444112 RepID=UPI003F688E3B